MARFFLTMSTVLLSTMYNAETTDQDMQYLLQPRGPGTGFVFRMRTPDGLIDKHNPWTGRTFGKELRIGLGTRHLQDAKKKRDVIIGEVRALEMGHTDTGRFSVHVAENIREQFKTTDEPDGIHWALDEMMTKAAERGVDEAMLRQFNRVATGRGYPLDSAIRAYVEARSPSNRHGFDPLAKTTVNDLHTAVRHLRAFVSDQGELLCLEDVTPKVARAFRRQYLPNVSTPRAPHGLGHKTVKKNVNILEGMWRWAIQDGRTRHRYKNPWPMEQTTPQQSAPDRPARDYFTAEEMTKLLGATPVGTREGDRLRLALVTGCRADEVAMLSISDVAEDGSSIAIRKGKTKNARRIIPIPEEARTFLRLRRATHSAADRLFSEWPIRQSVGKVYALSQWFTRFRRDLLGEETNDRLSLHSTRHTWRTIARLARVPEADVHQLGGWSRGKENENDTSAPYDHGLTSEQLLETQERIWDYMMEAGYLQEFAHR